ncbi:MAG: type II toxin-antitoxin system VapB family antitoxin [Moraxellaceae bacterium]|nr:type II toxin-antitoxin system VapB family antitoxin [Pseudomonadales bacterium]MCB1674152.1 type II toxin-antitoxin system VapB family antitoxin [Pseudomonadales bacterium]MCP5173956.1 type II toxin-antitoxin system VapB family antitoxin [Moraxellaceae bacterium]MCP5177621.1 type II toxin-antitoxin system VapB family antitoxin [Moraxellaceae bacterium]HQV23311.1 type II toxin-antitoxin system VapB family antitoxin [Agitococcus sp.]
MRTNIVIDDSLMSDALKVTGLKTKKEAVEQGLKMLIKLHQQQAIKAYRGKLTWSDTVENTSSKP